MLCILYHSHEGKLLKEESHVNGTEFLPVKPPIRNSDLSHKLRVKCQYLATPIYVKNNIPSSNIQV